MVVRTSTMMINCDSQTVERRKNLTPPKTKTETEKKSFNKNTTNSLYVPKHDQKNQPPYISFEPPRIFLLSPVIFFPNLLKPKLFRQPVRTFSSHTQPPFSLSRRAPQAAHVSVSTTWSFSTSGLDSGSGAEVGVGTGAGAGD